MTTIFTVLLAVLSIWDYPARHLRHERLRRQFAAAVREGDTATMEETCRKGIALLPDDALWHFNMACSLAWFGNRADAALDELEKAIDLGFRDAEKIRSDTDLSRLAKLPRFKELVEYADEIRTRPILSGPQATVAATGVFGNPVAIGSQNLSWNFELGCFDAHLRMAVASAGGNTGDLYMNRDAYHSVIDLSKFPGITEVRLDQEGRERKMDRDVPNIKFPYPVFGNASLAYVDKTLWRSLPRTMMTRQTYHLKTMHSFYLSNQTWVFPSNADTPPVGTHGDVFASIAPYWITTAGRSYSDIPYLQAALGVSRALPSDVKKDLVSRGLLAPTIQTLIRKSLKSVTTEDDYLTAKAHPTAFPADGVDLPRLYRMAHDFRSSQTPAIVPIGVRIEPVKVSRRIPELTYATPLAWAFVLRSEICERRFLIEANGAEEYAFVQTHGAPGAAKIELLRPNAAKVTIDKRLLATTNRVDITVVGRREKTGWGAPSYVSFAVMDPMAPYSDPVLTILPEPTIDLNPAK